MDDTRFDNLLRSLSSGASRRGALGLLLGGPLALLGLAETEAKKGKKRKRKRGGSGGGTIRHRHRHRHAVTPERPATSKIPVLAVLAPA